MTTLTRWSESGASYRVVELTDQRAVVELRTCTGEPEGRLESSDPALVQWLREAGAPD